MPRNQTLTHQHPAEFTSPPFGGPGTGAWSVRHWQTAETLPYAVATIARDLLADGWRELDEYDMRRAFGEDQTTAGIPVQRAFVHSKGGSRYGIVITLTDKRTLTGLVG